MTDTISLARAVSTPEPTVYDSASPVYRFLHRQITRLRAVLAQKGRPVLPAPLERVLRKPALVEEYVGRHRREPGQTLETRVRDAAGNDTGERVYWTPEPTFREKVRHVRAQRAARRDLAAAWMHTGAFPVIEDTGWIMRRRQLERIRDAVS